MRYTGVVALLLLGLAPALSAAGGLKVAAWNVEHLAAEHGAGCRPRSEADYARLRHYAAELDADVVALQEVENAEALARVFDPAEYAFEVSRRAPRPAGECWGRPGVRRTAQRVAFAIRRGVDYARNADVAALATGDGRHGVDITVFGAGQPLRLLAVHLKSGCFSNTEDARGAPDCASLDAQLPALENWLDGRTREGLPAVVLGDFNRRLTEAGDRVWGELNDHEPQPYVALTRGQRQACRGAYEGRPYIDHLVVNARALARVRSELRPLVYAEVGEAAPSDHCPIAASFGRWNPALRWQHSAPPPGAVHAPIGVLTARAPPSAPRAAP